MSVVICVNLIDRRRSCRNTAGAGLPLVRYNCTWHMVTVYDILLLYVTYGYFTWHIVTVRDIYLLHMTYGDCTWYIVTVYEIRHKYDPEMYIFQIIRTFHGALFGIRGIIFHNRNHVYYYEVWRSNWWLLFTQNFKFFWFTWVNPLPQEDTK